MKRTPVYRLLNRLSYTERLSALRMRLAPRADKVVGTRAALLCVGLMTTVLLQGCGPARTAAQTGLPTRAQAAVEPALTPAPIPTVPARATARPEELDALLEQLTAPVAGTLPQPPDSMTLTQPLSPLPTSPLSTSALSTSGPANDATVTSTVGTSAALSSLAITQTLAATGTLIETVAQTVTVSVTGGMPRGRLPTPTPTVQPASIEPTPVDAQPAPTSGPTPDGTARTVRVPILMYHYLSEPPPGADIYRQDLSVAPELFAAQLDAIRAAGYTVINLYDLHDYLMRGTPLPEQPVVITFDDGYRDNFENALPALTERDMTATFFIVTDFMDEERPEYLTWEMARAMRDAGMAIESHGRNHVSLANKDADYLVWQALGSRETIEFELGVRPQFVSYPAGQFDALTKEIFKSAGYWAGFTTVQGATHSSDDDLFEMRRVRVRNTTSPEELVRLLGLDW